MPIRRRAAVRDFTLVNGDSYLERLQLASTVQESPLFLARITSAHGKGLFSATPFDPHQYFPSPSIMITLPTRLHQVAFVKRNSLVVVQPFESNRKVVGELVHVLMGSLLTEWRKLENWPRDWDPLESAIISSDSNSDSQSDSEDSLFVNSNRKQRYHEDD